jgi:hypothetical protein
MKPSKPSPGIALLRSRSGCSPTFFLYVTAAEVSKALGPGKLKQLDVRSALMARHGMALAAHRSIRRK